MSHDGTLVRQVFVWGVFPYSYNCLLRGDIMFVMILSDVFVLIGMGIVGWCFGRFRSWSEFMDYLGLGGGEQ